MRHAIHRSLPLALLLSLGQPIVNESSAQAVKITIESDSDKKSESPTKPPFKGQRPAVDVAILLDTSNSMDGLINQAKSQLWTIVQQFSKAKKMGQTPLLRVSVFEYGNSGLPASEGYIRQVVPLTDNLDKVSEALFALKTNGGDEYCGTVIEEAVKRLDWNSEPNAYKAIFIAGNEPFDQGSVSYEAACKKSIGAGIVVNTIHCGNYEQGVAGHWKAGADLAEGEFLNINQDEQVIEIKCPQDSIIIQLNNELNKTYLWFGSKVERDDYSKNQAAQDSNALSSGGLSQRAAAKSSPLYRNVGRDLVDTYNEDKASISQLSTADFPEELQQLSPAERLEKIEAMAKRRAELKSELAKVSQERQAFIDSQQSNLATPSGTLGDAFSEAAQKQLEKSGFELEK